MRSEGEVTVSAAEILPVVLKECRKENLVYKMEALCCASAISHTYDVDCMSDIADIILPLLPRVTHSLCCFIKLRRVLDFVTLPLGMCQGDMSSSGINGEGELREQLAHPGSPGKTAVKTECECVCVPLDRSHITVGAIHPLFCLSLCLSFHP